MVVTRDSHIRQLKIVALIKTAYQTRFRSHIGIGANGIIKNAKTGGYVNPGATDSNDLLSNNAVAASG